jgi:hypothetical protein
MRRLGIAAASALVVCLGAVVVAMAGGPEAPLTGWAAPHDQQSGASPAAGARPLLRSRSPGVAVGTVVAKAESSFADGPLRVAGSDEPSRTHAARENWVT